MTDNEIRIAIAEVCGWEWHGDKSWTRDPCSYYWQRNGLAYQLLPDYPNDLNAMHEAEKALSKEQFLEYCESHLSRICCDEKRQELWSDDIGWTTQMIVATARQRAEAFLRTIGKWKG